MIIHFWTTHCVVPVVETKKMCSYFFLRRWHSHPALVRQWRHLPEPRRHRELESFHREPLPLWKDLQWKNSINFLRNSLEHFPRTSVTVTSASTKLYRRLSQWSWARRAPGSCGRHTSRFRCRWSGLARCATRGSFHWSNTWHETSTDLFLQRHLDLLTYLRYFYKFRNFRFSVMCIHERLRMKIFNVYVRGRPIQQHVPCDPRQRFKICRIRNFFKI